MTENTNASLGTPNAGRGVTGRQSLTGANVRKSGQQARHVGNLENLNKNLSTTVNISARPQEGIDEEEKGTNRSNPSSAT
jgi:hypothetical protein